MRLIHLLLLITLSMQLSAGMLDENNGPSEYYHQKLHFAKEAYLVEAVNITYSPGGTIMSLYEKDKVEILSIIKESFKGDRAKGESIRFYRIYDSDVSKSLPSIGQKYVIFLEEFDGEFIVSPQDPAAVWAVSEEIYEFLSKHK